MKVSRIARTALGAALMLVVTLLLLASGLLLYADHLRRQREAVPAAESAPRGGRWVPAGDAELFVQQWGPANGPMLVLSHGTGAWSGTWFELPDVLAAAGWRVVATDLPPFGFSRARMPSESLVYTRVAQARRLLALVDALGGRDVTLVGHSFGAGPALEAAMLDTGRLRRLILVDPALGLGSEGQAPTCPPAGVMDWLLSSRRLRFELVGATATQPVFTPYLLSQFVYRKEAVTPDRVVAYQIPFRQTGFSRGLADWAQVFSRSACEDARSLDPQALNAWAARRLPVTLLWGDEDAITPLAQARSLQQWIPQARLEVIAGAGHIPHIEAPDAFAETLLRVAR